MLDPERDRAAALHPADPGAALGAAALGFHGEERLAPLLRQVLARSSDLLGGPAGSVSLVEPGGDSYVKAAERGASCQLGRRFPLDEGVTGEVVRRRSAVVLARYGDLRAGHLPSGRPEHGGAVVAVPIWWRGDVIGANVLFAGGARAFTGAEVDELELLTQVAAAPIVRAGAGDPSLAHLLRRRAGREAEGVQTVVTEVGPARPVSPDVADAAGDLVARMGRAASQQADARLHVALVHRPDGLRLLLQDEAADAPGAVADDPLGTGARTWQELVGRAGGQVSVERVPGWGTLVRADFPSVALPAAPAPAEPAGSPLTARESEVLALLARGLSDREIAAELVLSPKTVEKHVGAVLRKTGARSRTAAVITGLRRGWVPD